jgi:RNA polymerase sigma-54 factor
MISLSQNLKLEQRLTPQQILLSTLLQLPVLNLEQKIKAELEHNPVLEEGDEEDLLPDEIIDSSPEENQQIEEELQLHEKKEESAEDYDTKELEEAQKETDLEDLINDEDTFEIRIPKDNNKEDYEKPEVSIQSLPEHLLDQMHILSLTETEFLVGEYLIWNIRDDGYLDEALSLEAVAKNFHVTEQIVEKILKKIQRLEPVGVASRNLRECLMVQLEDFGETETFPYVILRDYFEAFKNKKYDLIKQNLQIDKDQLQEAVNRIIKLNPKPGKGVQNSSVNYITPDFIVEKIDGEFVVSLNDWNIPPLRISNTYKKMFLDKKNTNKDARQYIQKKIESARWFIQSIYQRKFTMIKTMEAIVQKQFDFFENGPGSIKPLIMREIAEMIEMDISTVSRVANGKYVQTDYGVFELKYFFNERIETDSGEEISTRKIKARIKKMVEAENTQKPLSDEKISINLKKEGFPVARRTVAKYREQLSIPVARLRKGVH